MMTKFAYALATAAIGLITILVLSEVVLRLNGFKPWVYAGSSDEPVMYGRDSVLGWRNRPGDYVMPPFAPGGSSIDVTYLADGRRATGPDDGRSGDDGDLIIVGGSYTQGWAISDRETYAWKLQLRYPKLRVRNHGTGGFGTYQSLLVLEEAVLLKGLQPLQRIARTGGHNMNWTETKKERIARRVFRRLLKKTRAGSSSQLRYFPLKPDETVETYFVARQVKNMGVRDFELSKELSPETLGELLADLWRSKGEHELEAVPTLLQGLASELHHGHKQTAEISELIYEMY